MSIGKSWYRVSKNKSLSFPKITTNEKCDVVILGAGETGLATAIFLAEAGFKCVILEENYIGYGASGVNGGQFLDGFSCSLHSLVDKLGFDKAKCLFDLSVEAIDILQELIKKYNIDCDLVKGYYYAAAKKRHLKFFDDELSLRKKFGYDNSYIIPKSEVYKHIATRRYHGLLYNDISGHLHPLNLTLGMAEAAQKLGVKIYENSKILTYKQQASKILVKTKQADVDASYFVVAGNAYLEGINKKIENYIINIATYITATAELDPKLAANLIPKMSAVSDTNFALDYFRVANKKRLLYGGRASYLLKPKSNLKNILRERTLKTFPQLQKIDLEYTWGGYVSITMNRLPYFGKIGNNLLFTVGFSGHGVSLTLLAAKLTSQVILGSENKFNLFSKIPHFPFPGGKYLRLPLLLIGRTYHILKDFLG